MIPTQVATEELIQEFQITKESDLPTKTYKMHLSRNVIRNKTDGLDAMRQVIFKTLQTERYRHKEIYSDNFGVEFEELIGADPMYAKTEIERRIKEALLWDERILSVSNFEFVTKRNTLHVTFTAKTIFGDITESTQVKI